MNATDCVPPRSGPQNWQAEFVAMLSTIEAQLRREFRHLGPEAAGEAVQEGVAGSFAAFIRLQQKGRAADAYPGVLARFAARQVRAGRRVGGSLNISDPLSRYAQRRKGIQVKRIDRRCTGSGAWIEAAVADRRTSIPDRVALRVDVPQWLHGLSRRMRRIAKDLAIGFTTGEAADKYGVTAGRISQIRRELYRSWERFHWKEASGG